MNTRESTVAFFQGTPSVRGLLRALWQVAGAWATARRYRELDFRQAKNNEVTPEIHKHIDTVRRSPDEDFVNI